MGSLILTCLFVLLTQVGAVYGAAAQPCVPEACSLPNCRCAGMDIPGGLAANATPQMITISFDDALRVIDHEMFFKRILAGRKNPNGCDPRFTFFVSHDNTDYALLQTLEAEGHEMASHSITHRTELDTWWHGGSVENMTDEIVGMRDMMRTWGGATSESVKGWRTPFLATSENQIRVLYANNFTYESSMQTPVQYWPFTLDYKSPLCDTPATCPVEAYPGLWVIPNIRLLQANGVYCGMLDSCTHPQNQQQVYDLLVSNFERQYNSNRAPFGIYLHSAWFFDTEARRIEGLVQFLDYVANYQDTYIVTHIQLLEWVLNPTSLSEIQDFNPWKCPSLPPPPCTYQAAVSCVYPGPPWMQFKSCAVPSKSQCPIVIPDFGDIQGTNGSTPNQTENVNLPSACNPEDCQLPNCRCAGTSIPGGLETSDTPQMVTFGFIGSLQESTYDTYYRPALAGRTNPNGCSIPATFFVSNTYTSHALVESLAAEGHEIADYSVTARSPGSWWAGASTEDLTSEIMDMKEIIRVWINVAESGIKGFRSPFRASSENEIRILHENGFLYDASMETSAMYWPFTLDYKSPMCTSPATCPDTSYPGLWVLPNIVHDQEGTVFTCGQLGICLHTVTKAQWLKFFKDDFHRHYDGNRAPFSLYASVSWFYYPERVEALQEFLDYVANFTDTYFVTHSQLLDWVRSPTPLSEISIFEPWQCPSLPPARCDYHTDATSCSYTIGTGSLYLKLCATCPAYPPGLGNPQGEDPALSPTSMTVADLSKSSESVPSSSSEDIPPSSSNSIPSSSSENIPSSSSKHVPPSPSNSILSSSSASLPSSSYEVVSSSSSERTPPSSSESIPSMASSSASVPSSSSASAPSSSSASVPSSSSASVPSSSSEVVSSSSAEVVSSSSYERISSSSPESIPSSSSKSIPSSSSEVVSSSSSERVPPSSSEVVSSSSSESSPSSSSASVPSSSSDSIPSSSSEDTIPSTSEGVIHTSSVTITPSRSAIDALNEGGAGEPQQDASAVGLAVGLGLALTVAAVSIAVSTALVAYIIRMKRAAYSSIKGMSALQVELISNPSFDVTV